MEFGHNVIIPTHVLLDNELYPADKVLYGVLSGIVNRDGSCSPTNEWLALQLHINKREKSQQLNASDVQEILTRLQGREYIEIQSTEHGRAIVVFYQKRSVSVVIKKNSSKVGSEYQEVALKVLSYLNACLVVRGYKKSGYKSTEVNLKHIVARLSEGHNYDDCIAVINAKFEDLFFKTNNKYLNPETLFRPTKFEGYLSQANQIFECNQLVVTANGLEYPSNSAKASSKVGTF